MKYLLLASLFLFGCGGNISVAEWQKCVDFCKPNDGVHHMFKISFSTADKRASCTCVNKGQKEIIGDPE